MKKNSLTKEQLLVLPTAVAQFVSESKSPQDSNKVVGAVLDNIQGGIQNRFLHDIWIHGELDFYCLCRIDFGSDGEPEYTAYQLWIKPSLRSQHMYKRLIQFLRFYAQKHKFKRFNIVSSRLDKIRAYQRGIGYKFKPTYVTFSQEL